MRFPFVLFDAGETLIAPRESFGAVYARVLGTLGVALPAADLERGLRGCWSDINAAHVPGVDRYSERSGGEDAYWLRFVEGTLVRTPNAPRVAGLAARALPRLREAFRDPGSWVVFDDVVPALRSLKEAGTKLAVVSNWDSGLPALLAGLDLARWFDAIVVSHLEGVEKPDPELFLRAVRRLGGRPEQALHVGDRVDLDGAGAAAAGIESVIVGRPGNGVSRVPAIARGEAG